MLVGGRFGADTVSRARHRYDILFCPAMKEINPPGFVKALATAPSRSRLCALAEPRPGLVEHGGGES